MGLDRTGLQHDKNLVLPDHRGRDRACRNWNAPSNRGWQHLHGEAGRHGNLREREKKGGANCEHVL
jgi:hypothetical protein